MNVGTEENRLENRGAASMSGVGWVPNEGAGVREMFADGKNSGLPASVAVPNKD